jgi:uncharacterized protein (TIGR02266 family)
MAEKDQSRRKDPRAGCIVEVQYRSTGHLLMSYCTNRSRGGLFVCTADPLPIGERITLSLRVHDRPDALEIDGVVRWIREIDDPDGPRGMGLSFEDVDGVIGGYIDQMVGSFSPLSIEIVGDPGQAWHHIAALARSLVHCETRHRPLSRDLAPSLGHADLVIVDVDANPEEGIELLKTLATLPDGPPALALCLAREVELRNEASRYARVVPTPVDSTELQSSVLATLSQVQLGGRSDS